MNGDRVEVKACRVPQVEVTRDRIYGDRVELRFDSVSQRHMDFYLEISIPREELVRWLQYIDARKHDDDVTHSQELGGESGVD